MGHWVSLCVKCCRMVDSVPRWQLSLSWPIVRPDCDDTAFGAGTLTWQDPVHFWKAGPGEVMTVENLFIYDLLVQQVTSSGSAMSVYSILRNLGYGMDIMHAI
jgi:hypothetical protein